MTQQFASIELARLYESQGYLEDALTMYKVLDEGGQSNGSEVPAAIHRLEDALALQDKPARSDETHFEQTIAELRGPAPEPGGEFELEPGSESVPGPEPGREERIARLLDKWLMLMVVQKRVRLFRAIRARL